MSSADFETIMKLGEGAYSTVFKARRKSDGKIYALKKVRFMPLKDKEKENALTEVRILASIHNPNIIGYKEAFMEGNTLCIVMEFADGGDLLQRINHHKRQRTYFPEAEIWEIFIQAARGIKALHELQILHRDLKCANFFLNKDGSIKLGDMNVSKVAKRGLVYTQTGTPYYASPEVWKDQPYNHKSDIWSLGCVLYETCALEPPFKASDMKGLFRSVTKGEYPPLPRQYSADLGEVVQMMLKVDPRERPDCAQLLDHPLVRKHTAGALEDTASNSLLKTIKVPLRLNTLGKQLPAPAYNRKKVASTGKEPQEISLNRVNSERFLNEFTAIKPPRIDRIQSKSDNLQQKSDLLKPKNDLLKPRKELLQPTAEHLLPMKAYNHDVRRVMENHVRRSPYAGSGETIASRIKLLKMKYEKPAPPLRTPVYNRAVVRPTWWG